MTDQQPIIQFPLDCIAGIAEVWNGQYGHPWAVERLRQEAVYSPRILDIGANCGAFALWAKREWPHSHIVCYEPQHEIANFCAANTKDAGHIHVFNMAVAKGQYIKLHRGNGTRLQTTCYPQPNTMVASEEVECVDPRLLDESDVVKIDCEGGEADIVENISFTPHYLVLEYHSHELKERCWNALKGRMELLPNRTAPWEDLNPPVGMMKFLRIRK